MKGKLTLHSVSYYSSNNSLTILGTNDQAALNLIFLLNFLQNMYCTASHYFCDIIIGPSKVPALPMGVAVRT